MLRAELPDLRPPVIFLQLRSDEYPVHSLKKHGADCSAPNEIAMPGAQNE
jgi:hypothetical protein